MSPPEVLRLSRKEDKHEPLPFSLDDYAITANGFLPAEPPLKRLPNPYYAPWETLADSLPTALAEQTLRDQIDRLPVLSTDHLATEQEWRRACVVLGFLTHGYIWGGDTAAEILPPSITLPFLSISHHLGIPPIATYAGLNLWNFSTSSPTTDLTDLDALRAQHTFTGTEDESWFYMVSVAMEARGAYIIPVMLDALQSLTSPASPSQFELKRVTDALNEMTTCISHLGHLLDRMDEHCRPQVFYHRIRPFLAGSKNMAKAGLPRGVFYDEGEDGKKGEWRQLRGGSNGQSSLIQFLDVVLGVEHAAGGNGTPEGSASGSGSGGPQGVMMMERGAGSGGMSFHQEVRAYMPEPHRRFLEDVAARWPGGMRKAVGEVVASMGSEDGLSEELLALQEAFRTATKVLAEFRNKHLQIVARYIIIPSRQPNPDQGVNLATASSRLKGSEEGMPAGGELTGTGGTALLPFLKQSRDETFQAGGHQVQ